MRVKVKFLQISLTKSRDQISTYNKMADSIAEHKKYGKIKMEFIINSNLIH